MDEVPVVSVELITEDPADGFLTWRLKANPVPTREDLVVLVGVVAYTGELDEEVYLHTEPELIYGEPYRFTTTRGARLIVIRKNQNSSKEFKAIIPDLGEKFTLKIGIRYQINILRYIEWVWSKILFTPRSDNALWNNEISKRIFSVETNDGYVIPPDFLFPYYVPGEGWEKSVP